jgi:hypothetical protein
VRRWPSIWRGSKRWTAIPDAPSPAPTILAKQIWSSAILDLLVNAEKAEVLAYAEGLKRAADVAEGFIKEMAQKVAGDRNLDLDGKKRAVRNAIDIYAREIAGAKQIQITTPLSMKRSRGRGHWWTQASLA